MIEDGDIITWGPLAQLRARVTATNGYSKVRVQPIDQNNYIIDTRPRWISLKSIHQVFDKNGKHKATLR